MTGEYEEADIAKLTHELGDFLKSHDALADTLHGLSCRWQAKTGMRVEVGKLILALEKLCADSLLRKRKLVDGSILYIVNKT